MSDNLSALSALVVLEVLSWSFWCYHLLSLGLLDPFTALYLRMSCLFGSLCKEDSKFLEGMLCNCKRCLGKSYPCILLLSYCDEEGLDGMSSLISDGIIRVAVLSIIM